MIGTEQLMPQYGQIGRPYSSYFSPELLLLSVVLSELVWLMVLFNVYGVGRFSSQMLMSIPMVNPRAPTRMKHARRRTFAILSMAHTFAWNSKVVYERYILINSIIWEGNNIR